MSLNSAAKPVLEKAKKQEKEYKWLEAARLYEKALDPERSPGLPITEAWQNIGYCYSRASQQVQDIEEFKRLRNLAVEAYRNAAQLLESEKESKDRCKGALCDAMAEYTSSWLTSDSSERREKLEKCFRVVSKNLKALKIPAEKLEFVQTCSNILLCLIERPYLASTSSEKLKTALEGIDFINEVISFLSKVEKKDEHLLAHSAAGLQNWYAANIVDREERRKELADKSLSHSKKALTLSKQVDDPYYKAMSRWAAALTTLFFTNKIELSLQYSREMLQQGSTAKDNYLEGIAYYLLAFTTDWIIKREADPEIRKKKCREIIDYAEKAVHYLQPVCQDRIIAETYQYYTDGYISLANEEAEPEEKRALLNRAAMIGREGLKYAVSSDSPDAMASILHALSKALHFYSNLESGIDRKIELIDEALIHRKEYIKIVRKNFPSNDWVIGVGKYYEGLVEAELARLKTEENEKTALLETAASDMEDGVSRCKKWVSSRPTPSIVVTTAGFEDTFGGLLNELYLLTGNKEKLSLAIDSYSDAAQKFKEADLPSRVAESYWKIARNKDSLGRYEGAAQNFEDALTYYKAAAEKLHQFADFYMDYATYMEAWSEIEKAKSAHRHEKYTSAMGHYEKSANLLQQSKLWNHLSLNFYAWSRLEQAEDLSRKEGSGDPIASFKQAARLFEEARKSIEDARAQLGRAQDRDEEEMSRKIAHLSYTRVEYCLGRITVEEAKVLDSQGDHAASSEKYASAVKRFQRASHTMENEPDRLELQPIILLCQAWQNMTQAEAEASPDLYLEASRLFDEAKEHSFNEKAKLLALGHSRFCKALEAGARFEDTRDKTLHLAATQHLESAANYYIKAGFKTASEYAIATQRFLDGYVYTDNATKETDPEKKARFYLMAEKVLQSSAKLYSQAKHPEKNVQVQRLLDEVREKRELAASLTEVLHAPAITSSTASFVTPTPTTENAVGLERFEHANIQGHISVGEEIAMDEDLEIQLDLVNVAKNFGLLVRIDNIVPEGFKMTQTVPEYTVDARSINLEGKRFEPLKVESIKVSARATDFGIFKVNPQVIYIDETGQFRTCVPEAAHIKVLPAGRVEATQVKMSPTGRVLAEIAGKYELVYVDLLKEHPQAPRNESRVAVAQIGLSTSGDVLGEFYEEKAPGLFGLRQDKVELVRSKVRTMIEDAHEKKVDILLFPELTIDLAYNELMEDVTSLAKAYEMYIIPGSYHDQQTKRNISLVIGPEGILWRQEKHIPATIQHEGKRFTEGIDTDIPPRKTIICNTKYGRIAIMICRDFLDMDLRVELKNFEPPVDLVFNPAFTPVTADFRAAHFDARRSIYTYCFFANVAEFGDSFIYTPEKERVERNIPGKTEGLIYKDVDIFSLRSERKKWEKEQKRFIQSTR